MDRKTKPTKKTRPHPPRMFVKAVVTPDDGRKEVEFDASPWFKKASDDDIKKLVNCGFGGDYPADAVFKAHPKVTKDMNELSAYIEIAGCGYEVQVDEEQATEWLKLHKPTLLAELKPELFHEATEPEAQVPDFDEPPSCAGCGSEKPMEFHITSVNGRDGVPAFICCDCGHAHLKPTEPEHQYNEKMSLERQVDAEEAIAAIIHDYPDEARLEEGAGFDEHQCAELGRRILKQVLLRFRPDLFEGEKKPE